MVGDFSSKLGLPRLETVESIDANHMQMAKCKDRSDESYRVIVSVLKHFLRRGGAESSRGGLAVPVGSYTPTEREETPSAKKEVESC